ncbi:MAG: DUF507 family protein [Thermodesulfobacteriota bacterium]|nr:MAG: DUF507 family protein [Thermodesulfobacteriota bacterium]
MKLSRDQVEKIVRNVLERLKDGGLVVFKADERKAFEKMTEVFLADLRAEDELDREVEGLLQSHAGAIDKDRLDYRKMFNMIKGKLARERGIVL